MAAAAAATALLAVAWWAWGPVRLVSADAELSVDAAGNAGTGASVRAGRPVRAGKPGRASRRGELPDGPPGESAAAAGPDVADGLFTGTPGQPAAFLDVAIVLDLAAAALAGGASVPATFRALGRCGAGDELTAAGQSLLLGASWAEACAEVPTRLHPLRDALAPAWTAGVDPTALLSHAASAVRARRSREADVAAAKLGVRLVLPLGLCFLPAFVALGLVPVVLSFAGDLLGGG